jgi:hypothetical protein
MHLNTIFESEPIDDDLLSFAEPSDDAGRDVRQFDRLSNRLAAAYLARKLRFDRTHITPVGDLGAYELPGDIEVRYVSGLRPSICTILASTMESTDRAGCVALVGVELAVGRLVYVGFASRSRIRERLKGLEASGTRLNVALRAEDLHTVLPFEPSLSGSLSASERIWKTHFFGGDASSWQDALIDPFEALDWRSMQSKVENADAAVFGERRTTAEHIRDCIRWRSSGFTPIEAVDWYVPEGTYIAPESAAQFRDRDFTPKEAARWAKLDLSAPDAVTARTMQLSDETVRVLRTEDLSVGDVSRVGEWNLTISPETIQALSDWKSTCRDVDKASAWISAGFRPSEARQWFGVAISDPTVARAFSEARISPADARDWLMLNLDAASIRDWHEKGFTPLVAASWIVRGYTCADASEYGTLAFQDANWAIDKNIDLKTMREWARYGFSTFEMELWWDEQLYPGTFRNFLDHGFDPETARQLIIEHFNSDPVMYRVWRTAGFADDNMGWMDEGFTVEEALGWTAFGFDFLDALDWSEFTPSDAADWRDADFEPYEAQQWTAAGFDVSEADDLRQAGYTADSAKTRRRSGDVELNDDGDDLCSPSDEEE